MHDRLALLAVAIGVALMTYMVLVEDEPGAVPLVLIVLGAAWYVIARIRARTGQGGRGAEPTHHS